MNIASLAILALLLIPRLATDDPEAMTWGRDYTDAFFASELEEIWDNLSEQMVAAFGSLDALEGFRTQVETQLGDESVLVSENVQEMSGNYVYVRVARFAKFAEPIQVVWSFDGDGIVTGFQITPVQKEAPTEFLDYQTETPLRLPFEGEWFIFWGGRTLKQNYHAATVDQRFAYDILIMRDGKTHEGDGKKNEDYYCFGLPLVAPGDGVVAAAGDGVEDNVPGQMNPKQALGNHVILEHGNGEFSLMAHFQKGTVKVKKGDRVKAGQLLGLCGNSGNSSEPHLHYHLQTTAIPFAGKGLPVQFLDYVADGEPVARGEPVKGQVVRHAGKEGEDG